MCHTYCWKIYFETNYFIVRCRKYIHIVIKNMNLYLSMIETKLTLPKLQQIIWIIFYSNSWNQVVRESFQKCFFYIYVYLLFLESWRPKKPFFKNFDIWKMPLLKFLGASGCPPVKKFCQKLFQRVSTPKIKKSLPFEPEKKLLLKTPHLK